MQIQQIDEQLDDGPRIVVALFANTTQTSAEFIALGEDLKARLYNWHETAGVSVMDVLTLLQHWRDYVVYDESTSDNSLFLPYVCADIDIFKSVYCPIDTIHVKKAENNSPERIFLSMLLAIPGLGKASAEAIATHTKSSFGTLLAMSQEQIQAIMSGKKKIGTKVASCVFKALHT